MTTKSETIQSEVFEIPGDPRWFKIGMELVYTDPFCVDCALKRPKQGVHHEHPTGLRLCAKHREGDEVLGTGTRPPSGATGTEGG